MPICHRLEQKTTYQHRMAFALLVPGVALVALMTAHRFFTADYDVTSTRSQMQDSVDFMVESGKRYWRVGAFPALGQRYKIIPDDIPLSEQSAGIPPETTSFYPIHTTANLIHSVVNPLLGRYVAVTAPALLQPDAMQWDQSRAPIVKTRTEPDGIRNTVTLVVMIDSLGGMAPFNTTDKNSVSGAFYLLREGSQRDAETIYTSLRRWTFSPALDAHGNPVEALLTITHIPRGR